MLEKIEEKVKKGRIREGHGLEPRGKGEGWGGGGGGIGTEEQRKKSPLKTPAKWVCLGRLGTR